MTYVPPEPHERMLEEMKYRVTLAAEAAVEAKLRLDTLTAAYNDMERVCRQAIAAKDASKDGKVSP